MPLHGNPAMRDYLTGWS